MLKSLLTSCLSLIFLWSAGQSPASLFDFDQTNHVPVIENSDTLIHGWAGGLNYTLMGNMDLDLDGVEDLVVFDKNASRVLTFVARSTNGKSHFEYAPEYAQKFPEISHWMLIADFNCDGKKDIFFNYTTDVRVWENTSTTQLSFKPAVNGPLQSNYSGGPSNLFVSNVDLPAIVDIDGDGDMDILTFTNGGSVVEFHENISTGCGLKYRLKETCWGHFIEGGFYRSVNLDGCIPYQQKSGMHAGSTMLVLDLDGDNKKDLLLGNVGFEDITALYNGGRNDSVHFTSQDTLWPRYDSAIFVDIFPALSYVDVTFDGVPDIIASPYDLANASQNRKSIHLYENKGTAQNVQVEFVQRDFLQDGMIDLGAGAVPRLVDLSGDGLLDLVISNYGAYAGMGMLNHFYHYYINTGTASDPRFELANTDLGGISSLSANGLGIGTIPAFGDLNNDGTIDMIVGDEEGQLHYFTNSSSTNPNFTLVAAGFEGIDVGRRAAPFLYDIDGDGDLDLLIGNQQGRISYYENSSATNPSFRRVTGFFGAVNTAGPFSPQGNAVPYVFEKDSVLNLFVGSGAEGVFQYDSLDAVASLPPNLTVEIGKGTTPSSNFEETPFGITRKSGRNQLLIRAEELKAAGLAYGYLTGLSFDVTTKTNDNIWRLAVRLKSTSDTVLNDFHDNLTPVVSGNVPTHFPTDGWHRINFETPYLWDGVSNLVVEICYRGQTPGYDIHVNMTDVGYPAHALGDITNFNSLSANGCAMPYKNSISLRPNVRIDQTPSLVQSAVFSRGGNLAPAVADLDNDGFPDMIVGTFGGGVTYFKGKKYTISLPEEPLQPTTSNSLNVYPNPGTGIFTVVAPDGSKAVLQVYNLNGQKIMSQELHEINTRVNLENFPAGIYLFILESKDEIFTQKVIRQ